MTEEPDLFSQAEQRAEAFRRRQHDPVFRARMQRLERAQSALARFGMLLSGGTALLVAYGAFSFGAPWWGAAGLALGVTTLGAWGARTFLDPPPRGADLVLAIAAMLSFGYVLFAAMAAFFSIVGQIW